MFDHPLTLCAPWRAHCWGKLLRTSSHTPLKSLQLKSTAAAAPAVLLLLPVSHRSRSTERDLDPRLDPLSVALMLAAATSYKQQLVPCGGPCCSRHPGWIQGVAMGACLRIACKHVCPAPPFAQGGDEGYRPPFWAVIRQGVCGRGSTPTLRQIARNCHCVVAPRRTSRGTGTCAHRLLSCPLPGLASQCWPWLPSMHT